MNTAYPLFPVTLITFLAYFTTWLFSKWDIITLKSHRKFWNYLLLISFLISGLLGLLSVVKVNYKLEIAWYNTYMQWHVSFGIALVLIAFFHLSWHLKYYFSFSKSKSQDKNRIPQLSKNAPLQFRGLLFLLGMVALINQVIFIREFINVLSGNELVVGIVLSIWMLLTAWGALQGRKGNFSGLTFTKGIKMLAILSLLPVVLVTVLYLLKSLMFPPGTIVNISNSIVAAIILLFPVCFLSGYLFTAFSCLYSEAKNTNLTGKSYAFESLGSLAAGILFSIVLGRFFNFIQIASISFTIIILTGTWLTHIEEQKIRWKWITTGVLIPVLIFTFHPDKFITEMLFPNQELVANQSTRYGNLVITRQAGQINVYENNDLQFYTENVMMNEEAVHFAMVQHNNPKRILLISGGIAGMIKEIQKYNVEKITYLETNPEIFRILEKFAKTIPDTSMVEIVKTDVRKFVAKNKINFDVILMNLPPPSSLGMNRFYTDEFFDLMKKLCNTETVFSTTLPTTANYAEENALLVNSSLWKTLGKYFKNRMVLSGEKNYFLASDTQLSFNITSLITGKNIPTDYVNQYYLDDGLLTMRSKTLTSQFDETVPVNRDFYPYMFVKQIGHWLSYFGSSYRLLIIIPVLLFLLLFLRTNRITVGLYTGGFTAASLEVTLLLAYQVYFGSIYLTTAFFFAIFMAGLAFGSYGKFHFKTQNLKSYYLLQFVLAGFAILLPVSIKAMGTLTAFGPIAQILFFIVIFILALGIGYEFLLASKLREKSFSETSGENYSTDLLGSAFGAFLTAMVLLPLTGLLYTCLIVAGLNIYSGIMAYSAGKRSIFSV